MAAVLEYTRIVIPSEIDALCWEDSQVVLSALRAGDPDYSIQLLIFEKLVHTLIGKL